MITRVDSLKGGEVFGELTVVGYHSSTKRRDGSAGERLMLCKCSCGETKIIRTSNLRSGNTTSCGCVQSERTSRSNRERAKNTN